MAGHDVWAHHSRMWCALMKSRGQVIVVIAKVSAEIGADESED